MREKVIRFIADFLKELSDLLVTLVVVGVFEKMGTHIIPDSKEAFACFILFCILFASLSKLLKD